MSSEEHYGIWPATVDKAPPVGLREALADMLELRECTLRYEVHPKGELTVVHAARAALAAQSTPLAGTIPTALMAEVLGKLEDDDLARRVQDAWSTPLAEVPATLDIVRQALFDCDVPSLYQLAIVDAVRLKLGAIQPPAPEQPVAPTGFFAGPGESFGSYLKRATESIAEQPAALQQSAEPVELRACRCGNNYLAIRTDIYKDKREFIYCDCCGAMADRKTWQAEEPSLRAAPDGWMDAFGEIWKHRADIEADRVAIPLYAAQPPATEPAKLTEADRDILKAALIAFSKDPRRNMQARERAAILAAAGVRP